MARRNKVALITGGAKRIGKSVCFYLAKQGYDIALHYNTSEQEALTVQNEIRNLHGVYIEIFQCDFTQLHNIKDLMESVYHKFSDLDVLINNASIFERIPFANTSIDDLQENFAVNMIAPFLLSQEFYARSKSGYIINMLDRHITSNKSAYFPYLLSKKSLADLTKMLVDENSANFRVNGICIGITELSQDFPTPNNKKIVMLADINKAISTLLANDSITGQNIFLDGQHLS